MVLVFSVLIGLALDFAGARPAEKYYASRYDHIDVEAILNNRRLVNYYAACLLSKGPCPPEGIDLKRILPEALQGNCERCSEKQATVARRVLRRLQKEYPKVWLQLSEKWDPDDIYVRKFEASFESKSGPFEPSKEKPVVLNRFGGDEDKSTDNDIDGSFPLSTTTTTHKVLTTVTKTNSIPPSSTIATSTKTEYPYQPTTSLVSTNKTTTKPSSTSSYSTTTASSTTLIHSTSTSPRSRTKSTLTPNSTTGSSTTILPTSTQPTISSTTGGKTSTRQPIIPGFIPINTFFTNPPIPVRPLINFNIGANIGATVKAIKQVESVVAGIALEKIGMIKNLFMLPWRKTRRKYS